MKKIVVFILAFVACVNAYAFKFDGIDLNGNVGDITRAISKKNYVATVEDPNVLTGLCQGTKINLSFNLVDVTEKNHIGQLIVEKIVIPICQLCHFIVGKTERPDLFVSQVIRDDARDLVDV